jgi:threonine/homoserine/homoserine lactone efflux protein
VVESAAGTKGDDMGEAIGQVLPMAVGVALSPIPIIAVVLMLVSRRARVNGPIFIVGWLVGLAIVGVIVLAILGPNAANDDGEPTNGVSWLKVVLGVLLLLVAARQWRSRPDGAEDPPMPKWMGAIDDLTPAKAAGAGALLSAANPKNLVLAVGAGAAIAQTAISGGEQAIAYAVFAIIGTIGVAAPVVIYFLMADRAPALLAKIRAWMSHNNAVIMSVLCLIIGVKLIGDGIGGF